jgi:hypothetical protein
MAVTFSIGGVPITALAHSAGRKAMACRVGAPHYILLRYHPMGGNGNFLIRGGRDGMPIHAVIRYIGTSGALAESLFAADKTAWSNVAVTIIDENGDTWTNCNLASAERLRDPKGIGGAGDYYDALFLFTWDG